MVVHLTELRSSQVHHKFPWRERLWNIFDLFLTFFLTFDPFLQAIDIVVIYCWKDKKKDNLTNA